MSHPIHIRLMAFALHGLIILGLGILIGSNLWPRTVEIETGRVIECTLPPSEEDILRVCKGIKGNELTQHGMTYPNYPDVSTGRFLIRLTLGLVLSGLPFLAFLLDCG